MSTIAPNATSRPEPSHKGASPLMARSIDARALLGGEPLLIIEHGETRYFLRMTRNNKLILTK